MVRVDAILESISRERDENEGIEDPPGNHDKTITNRGNGVSTGPEVNL